MFKFAMLIVHLTHDNVGEIYFDIFINPKLIIFFVGLTITTTLVSDVVFSDHCCIYFDVSALPVQRNSSRLLKRGKIKDKTIESFQKM